MEMGESGNVSIFTALKNHRHLHNLRTSRGIHAGRHGQLVVRAPRALEVFRSMLAYGALVATSILSLHDPDNQLRPSGNRVPQIHRQIRAIAATIPAC